MMNMIMKRIDNWEKEKKVFEKLIRLKDEW